MAVYPGQTVERPPAFTLYSDGRALYLDWFWGETQGEVISLREAYLSSAQIERLVAFALDEGGLAEAQAAYMDAPISDAGNTIFEIDSDNTRKRVIVYALGYTADNTPEAAIRAKLGSLAQRLESFATVVSSGGAEDRGTYEPDAFRVTLDSPPGPMPNPDDVGQWPWPDLQPSDFRAVQAVQGLGRQLTPEQVGQLTSDPLNAPNDLLISHPDGGTYLVRIRALLPDEVVPTT